MCKAVVNNLGANKTASALKRAGRCIGVLLKLINSFDSEFGVSDVCGAHSSPSAEKDMNIILQELIDNNVFSEVKDRGYFCTALYSGLKGNPLSAINIKLLHKWMVKHLTSLRSILYD
jgi:hypothetical protein